MQGNERTPDHYRDRHSSRGRTLSRRNFLKGVAAGATVLGLGGLLPIGKGMAQSGDPDGAIGVLPPGLKELIPRRVWLGPHTRRMADGLFQKLVELRNAGVIDDLALGADRGSLFLRGPDGRYYELAVGTRGVYHLAGGELVTALVVRDLAAGRVQLDAAGRTFFDLPRESLTLLMLRPVAGAPASGAPSLAAMRGWLTIAGTENRDQALLGEPALKTLNQEGALGRVKVSTEIPSIIIGAYQNGHNLPQGTLDFLSQEYAAKGVEILGLPISDPYWLQLGSRDQPAWVLTQVFEAGLVTFNPQLPSGWQYEASPTGRLLIAVLNHGSEDLPAANEAGSLIGQQRRPFENKVGWAFTAKPECTFMEMRGDMLRMRDNGSNTVYLTHNNPGDVNPYGKEPGLAYAVFFALRYNTYSRGHAKRIYSAVLNALDAARALNLDVVLPVGYQISMGPDWNSLHPDDLRRDADGSYMNHWDSGPTASPYSPTYRRDIAEYYRWVNDTILSRYRNVIAVNVADEPMGSDFSGWARRAFQDRYEVDFEVASDEQRGEFLSGVIADYLSWSASVWKEINPSIWVTSSLHIQRDQPWFPDVEAIFERTPDNFVVSADTHLHDSRMDLPISDADVNLLRLMTRTLGWLSNVYNKPLLLWSSANAWGLGGRSSHPGGIAEAKQNLNIVSEETRRNGGLLGMIMAWAYNVAGQELTDVSFDEMFQVISADLQALRGRLTIPGGATPENVLGLDRARLYQEAGRKRTSLLLEIGHVDLQGRFGDVIRDTNAVFLRSGKALETVQAKGAKIILV